MKVAVINSRSLNVDGQLNLDRFSSLGELVIGEVADRDDDDAAIALMKDADAAYISLLNITKKMLDECPKLKIYSLSATGYDWIPKEILAYAREKGVLICNNPLYGSSAVAQQAFALLMELTNAVGIHDRSLRNGDWARNGHSYWLTPLHELLGKTVGVIGMGNIGTRFARMAAGFDTEILTYSEYISEEGKKLAEQVSLEELLRRSDIISLHCPLFDSTREMINKETIAQMKDGAILINSARGGLINEQDVADALKSGKLGGYGADAFTVEPITADNPLLSAPNCCLTPHLAWMPLETRQRNLDHGAANIEAYFAGNPVNVINR